MAPSDIVFPSQYKKDIEKLQQSYLERLKSQLADFRRFREMVSQNMLPRRDLQQVYRLSHNFAGSGATFGFPDISRTARNLHTILKEYVDQPEGTIDTAQKNAEILDRLQSFEKACMAALNKPLEETMDQLAVAPAPSLALQKGDNDIYIFFTSRDTVQVKALSESLIQFGYNCIQNPDRVSFADAYKGGFMKAIIVYSELIDSDLKSFRTLFDRDSHLPLMIVCPYDDIEARLSAARLGAQGFFAGNADALQIIEKIEKMAEKYMQAPNYNVLIVDDDEMLSEFYRHAIQRSGMKAYIVNNPKDALQVLFNNDIHLMLVDFSMPGCNGDELASVIRQYDAYLRLPIVFISSQEDIEQKLLHTGLGVDDFLLKPFTPMQMISVIKSRAQRASELKTLMVRDSFTGLINHAHFIELLHQENMRVQRNNVRGVYAIIDIDHFKNINDTYGHQTGDIVIKNLSRMLQQHMRRTDIIGRCGGEEFGVLMPGCSVDNAFETLEKMRVKFASSSSDVMPHGIRVTFSCGIVAIDGVKTPDKLIQAADKALYNAKSLGRNQVIKADAS